MDLTTADESEDTLHVECVCERAATAARAITRKRGERFKGPLRHAGAAAGVRAAESAWAHTRAFFCFFLSFLSIVLFFFYFLSYYDG